MLNKQYAKKAKKHLSRTTLLATDVLYSTMTAYNKEHKSILQYLVELVKANNTNLPQLKQLYMLMNKAGEVAIDCAHKLAPYQSPKLESIEVRNQVEHKFVIRSPEKAKSIEEWAKMTGAQSMDYDPSIKKEEKVQEPAPSIHDFDTDEEVSAFERDAIETNKLLYN